MNTYISVQQFYSKIRGGKCFWDRVKIIVMVLAFGFIIYINENVLVNLIFSNDMRIFNWFYMLRIGSTINMLF